jgi:hypothetical protein
MEAIRRLHPGVNFARDVIVYDPADGTGPVLQAWNLPGSPPTDAEIAAVMAAPVIPRSVTMLSARRALRAAGLLDKVNAAIATQTPDIQDAWEYAPTIARQSPTVKLLAAALALSETQVDALFVSAGSLAAL